MLLESETHTILEHSNQITIDCTVAVNTTFVDRDQYRKIGPES